jgi:hypothetical protein
MARTTSTSTLDSPAQDDATLTGESTHPLAETGREAGQRATHLVERTAEIGIKQADRGLAQAASGVESVADHIRRVSADMEGEQPQVAEFALTAADQAEALAGYLREHDVRQIIGGVESFARRQPLLFLGGAFLLGMAASRFIKAAAVDRPAPVYASGYSTVDYGTPTNRRSGRSGDWPATGPGTSEGTRDA